MTDAELIARLRNSKGWPTLGNAAADRIEALSISNATLIAERATCEKYRDAYAEMGRIGTQAVRDLEAKLAKAVEALETYACGPGCAGGKCYDTGGSCGQFATDTIAEIKGENHE